MNVVIAKFHCIYIYYKVCPNEKETFAVAALYLIAVSYCACRYMACGIGLLSYRSGLMCLLIDGVGVSLSCACVVNGCASVSSVLESCCARSNAWWIPPDQLKELLSNFFASKASMLQKCHNHNHVKLCHNQGFCGLCYAQSSCLKTVQQQFNVRRSYDSASTTVVVEGFVTTCVCPHRDNPLWFPVLQHNASLPEYCAMCETALRARPSSCDNFLKHAREEIG